MSKGTFDASNHYYFPSPVTDTPLTFCTWVYRLNATTDASLISLTKAGGSIFGRTYGWRLTADNSGNYHAQTTAYTDSYYATVVQGSTDKWIFIATTFDSNNTDRAIYQFEDGVMTSDTDSNALDPNPSEPIFLAIGTSYNAKGTPSGGWDDGYLSRVAGWNTVLSENEIRSIAFGASPPQIQADKLFFYIDLVEYKRNIKLETPVTEVGSVPTQSLEPGIQVAVPFSSDNSQSNTGGGSVKEERRKAQQPLYGLKLIM